MLGSGKKLLGSDIYKRVAASLVLPWDLGIVLKSYSALRLVSAINWTARDVNIDNDTSTIHAEN